MSLSLRSFVAAAAIVSATSTSAFAADRCGWVDGMEPAAPADDPGRGVSDWFAHQGYVLSGPGQTTAAGLVGARLTALRGCLSKEQFARIYADLSLLIGAYGRSHAGWVNAMDPAAPADDPGRGIAAWQAHADHVLKGPGLTTAPKFVPDRLRTLSGKVSKEVYARIYADVSIFVANYARIASGQ